MMRTSFFWETAARKVKVGLGTSHLRADAPVLMASDETWDEAKEILKVQYGQIVETRVDAERKDFEKRVEEKSTFKPCKSLLLPSGNGHGFMSERFTTYKKNWKLLVEIDWLNQWVG